MERSKLRVVLLDVVSADHKPITLIDTVTLMVVHMEDIKREMAQTFEIYMEAASIIVNKYLKLKEIDDSKILYFDDVNADQNLVYTTTVNPFLKRITVSFRGSVTLPDMFMDAKVSMVQIPNPVARYRITSPDNFYDSGHGAPDIESLGIHRGFRDYLFGCADRFSYPTLKKGEGRKVDKITRRVLGTLDEYPGYSIAVTGHSLGRGLGDAASHGTGKSR